MPILKRWLFPCLLVLASALRAEEELPPGLYAEFETPRGTFVAELHYRQAPMTVTSFVGLAEGTIAARNGQPFYTGLKWFRVVPGFVIQGGDPDYYANQDTDRDSAPYNFPDEFAPGLSHSTAGILSMANAGPDTNSTQFFFTLGDSTRLNYLHSIFGRVVRGLDVLPQIQADDPFSIRVLRLGADAQAFRADEASFRALVARAKKYESAFFEDEGTLLPTEPPRAKNFNYKLANFARFTGLKIKARLFAKSPTAGEDAVPGAFMRTLGARLGTVDRGVTVAYFADENDWRVWLSEDLVAAFLGRPVQPADLGDGGALHNAKMAMIEKAQADGDTLFAKQQAAAQAEGRPAPVPGQRIKLQADALLDALILRLEPR